MKRLYVGNLGPDITESEVRDAFSQFGTVISVALAADRYTGSPRGFAYVEMEEGDAAIAGLNRTELKGRALTVCGARPKDIVPASGALLASGALSTSDRASMTLLYERRALGRGDGR